MPSHVHLPSTLAALLMAASACAAASPLDGRWVLEATSTHVAHTDFEIALADGRFACNWCSPAWRIPADGRFHPVSGQRGYDEAAVRIIDDRSAAFQRKRRGQEYYAATDRVSADGRHLVFAWVERSADGSIETGTGHWIRRGKPTPGAHPVTGRWRELWTRATASSTGAFTLKQTGRTLHVAFGPGQSFTATLDGPAVRMDGDQRGTQVSLRSRGRTGFIQTERVNGTIVAVTRHRLRDADTMDIEIEHRASRTLSRYTARRLWAAPPTGN